MCIALLLSTRHQILRNKRRKPGGDQERTIHQMSPLLQSPATTLTGVGSGNSKRTGSMTDLDQGFSPSRSNSPTVRKKRRAGSKAPSPCRLSLKKDTQEKAI